MVGGLGLSDTSQIWRWPEDEKKKDSDWTRFIQPQFQSCMAEALVDVGLVSRATFDEICANSQARTQFLQLIKYEYSNTKLGMKGTFRQLDAKGALSDGFREASRFFRLWRLT
jgi:hypothetical protein